ncbi:hypothetical protein RJ640_023467 [Escallonia rubra]|uniref:Uncharacterized protein n=1 Tax=Escallonia rubra TaxID=112253 RepID=A0AA88UNX7_9ASTE|nr:hypothetical protein RJ640_023467 [Escallonia rubra]
MRRERKCRSKEKEGCAITALLGGGGGVIAGGGSVVAESHQLLVEAFDVLEQFVSRWCAFFDYGIFKKILKPSAKQRHGLFIDQLHIGDLLDHSSPDSHPTDANIGRATGRDKVLSYLLIGKFSPETRLCSFIGILWKEWILLPGLIDILDYHE